MGGNANPPRPHGFRTALRVVSGVLVAVGAAFQLAGVTTAVLANIVLVVGVWLYLLEEVWFSDWISRVQRYKPAVVSVISCAVGCFVLYVSYMIHSAKIPSPALEVYPKQFRFSNPPMPPERFTVTVANREDHSVYQAQFLLRIQDEAASHNDYRAEIAPGSVKLMGLSKDGSRGVADILLFKCRDSNENPVFLFFIPTLNAKETREVLIESTNHSTSSVHAEAVDYDEAAHSLSTGDGNVGLGLQLSKKANAHDCRGPSEVFMEIGKQPGPFRDW